MNHRIRHLSFFRAVLPIPVSIIICLIIAGVMGSCCKEKVNHYRLPEETLRYYKDQDSILFYCIEANQYEIFVVCKKNSDGIINRVPSDASWCIVEDWFDYREYYLRRDTCTNSRLFLVSTVAQNTGDLTITILSEYSDSKHDYIGSGYNNKSKSDIEIMSFTYENTINFNSEPQDRLAKVIFSLEYGIVQYQVDSLIFCLINDEK